MFPQRLRPLRRLSRLSRYLLRQDRLPHHSPLPSPTPPKAHLSAFRLRSLKLRFFRSGTFVQAAFPLSYISTSSLRPLCSTAVTRFLATMGLSDSRQGPTTGYLFPVAVLPLRASQVPLPIFPRALPPLTPTSPTIACARYFIAGPRLPLLRLIGHSFLLCNEAETGSLALRLACSPCKASPVELLPLTLAWLLAERAIYKISSFQNIRSARIILALPKFTKRLSYFVLLSENKNQHVCHRVQRSSGNFQCL